MRLLTLSAKHGRWCCVLPCQIKAAQHGLLPHLLASTGFMIYGNKRKTKMIGAPTATPLSKAATYQPRKLKRHAVLLMNEHFARNTSPALKRYLAAYIPTLVMRTSATPLRTLAARSSGALILTSACWLVYLVVALVIRSTFGMK